MTYQAVSLYGVNPESIMATTPRHERSIYM